MNIKRIIINILLCLCIGISLQAKDEKVIKGMLIRECSSGVDYPTEGDEYVKEVYKGLVFHAKILHPKVLKGPHFSSPFFWVSEKKSDEEMVSWESLVTTKNHMEALSWLSANGYFFAQKKGKIRGFFFEDGFDSADYGSSGLIFVYDGKKSTLYRWQYDRGPEKEKDGYQIFLADDKTKKMPKKLLKDLAPVLKHAESEANFWPGA